MKCRPGVPDHPAAWNDWVNINGMADSIFASSPFVVGSPPRGKNQDCQCPYADFHGYHHDNRGAERRLRELLAPSRDHTLIDRNIANIGLSDPSSKAG